MTKFSDKRVKAVFRMFPPAPRRRLLELRKLVFEAVSEIGIEDKIEETLKWGEPSYVSPAGSTVRMGWAEKDPDFVRLFFHCQTTLVETFRELFPHLVFEENRAIKLPVADPLETKALKKCIELSLIYHTVKHLPLLGAG